MVEDSRWWPGICGHVHAHRAGTCASANSGLLDLPRPSGGRNATKDKEACLELCSDCARCRHVSLSSVHRQCHWFWKCPPLDELIIDPPGQPQFLGYLTTSFQSSAAIPVPRPTPQPVLQSISQLSASPTVYTERTLRRMRDNVERPLAAKMLSQWLGRSTEGVCAYTLEGGDEGDCDEGEQGVWKLDNCEATSQHVALAHCLLRCSRCARCAYVSVSVPARECSWYRHCRLERLNSAPVKLRFVTGAVSANESSFARLTLSARAHAVALPPSQREFQLTALLRPPEQKPHALFSQFTTAGKAQPAAASFSCSEVSAAPLPADNASPTGGRAVAQMCSAAALAVGHAWLVLGVFSGLGSTARRADIRATWWGWEALRQHGEARACFILAWRGDRAAVNVAQKEARKHGDVVQLLDATEGCSGCSYSKFYAWWRWAGSLPDAVTHVAKTEDDAIVHVPNLLADLVTRRRTPFLYYGSFQWAGLRFDANHSRLRACGFSWQGPHVAKVRCSLEQGGYPGSPFASGPLELVSADLARRLATDAPIARFVARATRRWAAGRTDEDVLLGVWIAHLQASTPGLHITYANAAGPRLGDLHCRSEEGMYQVPRTSSILSHRVGSSARLNYAWRVMRGCAAHNVRTCWAAVYSH